MAKGTGDNSDAIQVVWTGKLTAENIPKARDEISALLNNPGKVILLDLSGVEEVDFPFIQFLCSAHKTSHNQGKKLEFGPEIPKNLSDSISFLGFCQGCLVYKSGAALC